MAVPRMPDLSCQDKPLQLDPQSLAEIVWRIFEKVERECMKETHKMILRDAAKIIIYKDDAKVICQNHHLTRGTVSVSTQTSTMPISSFPSSKSKQKSFRYSIINATQSPSSNTSEQGTLGTQSKQSPITIPHSSNGKNLSDPSPTCCSGMYQNIQNHVQKGSSSLSDDLQLRERSFVNAATNNYNVVATSGKEASETKLGASCMTDKLFAGDECSFRSPFSSPVKDTRDTPANKLNGSKPEAVRKSENSSFLDKVPRKSTRETQEECLKQRGKESSSHEDIASDSSSNEKQANMANRHEIISSSNRLSVSLLTKRVCAEEHLSTLSSLQKRVRAIEKPNSDPLPIEQLQPKRAKHDSFLSSDRLPHLQSDQRKTESEGDNKTARGGGDYTTVFTEHNEKSPRTTIGAPTLEQVLQGLLENFSNSSSNVTETAEKQPSVVLSPQADANLFISTDNAFNREIPPDRKQTNNVHQVPFVATHIPNVELPRRISQKATSENSGQESPDNLRYNVGGGIMQKPVESPLHHPAISNRLSTIEPRNESTYWPYSSGNKDLLPVSPVTSSSGPMVQSANHQSPAQPLYSISSDHQPEMKNHFLSQGQSNVTGSKILRKAQPNKTETVIVQRKLKKTVNTPKSMPLILPKIQQQANPILSHFPNMLHCQYFPLVQSQLPVYAQLPFNIHVAESMSKTSS